MKVTRKMAAERLLAWLGGELPKEKLVDWAENALLAGDFSDHEMADLTEILAKIGLADVRAFGLTWEDCSELMARLGYRMEIRAALAA